MKSNYFMRNCAFAFPKLDILIYLPLKHFIDAHMKKETIKNIVR